jgi:hypothetical protein
LVLVRGGREDARDRRPASLSKQFGNVLHGALTGSGLVV